MPLSTFHPAVRRWFAGAFEAPTPAQALAWPAIAGGRHTLVAAPTGSGKTLAAFLAALDGLTREALDSEDGLPDETRVVYVSPLKALSNDVHRNLELPLAGIEAELEAAGLPAAGIRRAVRTGDTPSTERSRMTRKPPHLLVTTPESLYILLGSRGGRRTLATARTVIVDEIHAVAGNKRGSHLALSLERLDELVARSGHRLTRIGLSATQKPLDLVARFLTGTGDTGAGHADRPPPCEIVDVGHQRRLDLAVEVPESPLEAVMSHEVWAEVYDRLAELVEDHRTTLVFVNTRRLAERLTRHLEERLGEGRVAAHHGSLSKEQRLESERRLKAGELSALVATASLELGIDVGAVDLVCQIGSTRSIATLLQRVGRAGHFVGGSSKGRLFPLSRDELVECAALLDAVGRGELDRLHVPEEPLDVLAQQVVATVAAEGGEEGKEWGEDELYALVRRAWPYRALARPRFDAVVEMLAHGFATRHGRRGAYLHHDAVHRRLRPRRGARLTALTSGGAIPDTADFQVVLEPAGTVIGSVNEDFAVESIAGDVFQLGNASWRILRVERNTVRVEDARGEPPNIPFWFGEAPGRTDELSAAVSRLRREVDRRLAEGRDAALAWLVDDVGVAPEAAVQLVAYLAAARSALGVLPSDRTLVAERFFDDAGDMHLVVHSPLGSRLNRAWGLALRKRFCRTFDFELQAAAGEDALVLSLGPTHSFPLETVFEFLASASARDLLVQALLDAPMFGVRWRWNASRSLALPRMRGGRRVPPQLQRHQAENLLAVVFPDQLACLENIAGDREIPDHPLVEETLRDCLTEAMDVDALERLLAAIEAGEVTTVARDLTEPSPLAHEILNARPYAFLDDAPLEERRTQAISMRRWLDPDTAADLGTLDAAAIERVRDEARPDPRDAEELHDALVTTGWVQPCAEWEGLFTELTEAGRAALLTPAGGPALWVAAERLPELRAVFPDAALEPDVEPPARLAARTWEVEEAVVELVRARMDVLGPVTAAELAGESGLAAEAVDRALAALEAEGSVLRGRFTPDLAAGVTEWCERRLLARIHRATLSRLRREIEPVGRADLTAFLLGWQQLTAEERGEGPAAVEAVLDRLAGFSAPAAAWEGEILPARVADYDPAWLDALCLSGRWVWCRATPPDGGRSAPLRTTPVTFLPRAELAHWRQVVNGRGVEAPQLSADARVVVETLERRGASFFADLAAAAGLLHTRLEAALAELVACGLVTADSFTGLRALLVPADRRPSPGGGKRRRHTAPFGMEGAGRWSLLGEVLGREEDSGADGDAEPPLGWSAAPEAVETVARTLLARYGVLFRALVAREELVPPWRELLWTLRKLEARGEVRGGRFVTGFSGEQYALPDAVARLRAARRRRRKGEGADELISISAADPLNLAGVLTPGDRLPALTGNRLLYRGGRPLAVRQAQEVRFLGGGEDGMEAEERWEAEKALVRTAVPPVLRPYLGRTA